LKRAVIGGILAGVLAVAAMAWLLSTWKQPPTIPDNAYHREARRSQDCVQCHNVDGPSPRSKNHPLNDRCFQCHLWPGQKGL
jgi:hypothetical protein